MHYSQALLKNDINTEKHYLDKIVSTEAMQELTEDFDLILAKLQKPSRLNDYEKEKVLYIYNRYHGTTEFVTADQVLCELYKEVL